MRASYLRFGALIAIPMSVLLACGSRTGLTIDDESALGGGGGGGTDAGTFPDGQPIPVVDASPPPPCVPGTTVPCGSSVGACKPGLAFCQADAGQGECVGGVKPTIETCNAIDDDCNGTIDDGFNVGGACDGPDTDLCLDDTMSCGGCSSGPNNVEVCNGVDDNCNGTTDSDCDFGDCKPSLTVTSSVPSDPGCVDFPVEKGSTGTIEYPCAGGPVTARIGAINFTGTAQNGSVKLTGTATQTDPVGCLFLNTHTITGVLGTGDLTYSYSEMLIDKRGHNNCYSPCTETGTVKITW
jgi:hypothetical protein